MSVCEVLDTPVEELPDEERAPVEPGVARKIGCVPTALCVGCPMLKLCGPQQFLQEASLVTPEEVAPVDEEYMEDLSFSTLPFEDDIFPEVVARDAEEVGDGLSSEGSVEDKNELDDKSSHGPRMTYLDQLFDDNIAIVVAKPLLRPVPTRKAVVVKGTIEDDREVVCEQAEVITSRPVVVLEPEIMQDTPSPVAATIKGDERPSLAEQLVEEEVTVPQLYEPSRQQEAGETVVEVDVGEVLPQKAPQEPSLFATEAPKKLIIKQELDAEESILPEMSSEELSPTVDLSQEVTYWKLPEVELVNDKLMPLLGDTETISFYTPKLERSVFESEEIIEAAEIAPLYHEEEGTVLPEGGAIMEPNDSPQFIAEALHFHEMPGTEQNEDGTLQGNSMEPDHVDPKLLLRRHEIDTVSVADHRAYEPPIQLSEHINPEQMAPPPNEPQDVAGALDRCTKHLALRAIRMLFYSIDSFSSGVS